ncbi:hypothetical protein [Falsiroseomonas sp.]|uniref:hypothetical protein n=1 Tax=Falsiroseomonas sp. TaxID=2870721 RepID=UPI003561AF1A
MVREELTADPGWVADAALDPWLLVSDGPGSALFGYATGHPATGGLAWTLSTPVRQLDTHRSRAVTASGRRYDLGRRIDVSKLPDEEARFAYALLVCPIIGSDPAAHLGSADPLLAADWVRACKMARHLGVTPPERDVDALSAFLQRHADAYFILMRRKLGY